VCCASSVVTVTSVGTQVLVALSQRWKVTVTLDPLTFMMRVTRPGSACTMDATEARK
jgi:hypothetical protein